MEIIANTLRMFGQGVKVCVEVATMALDAGLIPYGEDVIAAGVSGVGGRYRNHHTPVLRGQHI